MGNYLLYFRKFWCLQSFIEKRKSINHEFRIWRQITFAQGTCLLMILKLWNFKMRLVKFIRCLNKPSKKNIWILCKMVEGRVVKNWAKFYKNLPQNVLQIIQKSFKKVHLGLNVYWLSFATILNSITDSVLMLIVA